jgi:HTH-type transcriptional regulator/antitoxin HigA
MRNDEIENDEGLQRAIERLDQIWSVKPEDEFWKERETLIEQIAAYEEHHVQIEPPSPVDAILFRIEQGGLSRKDLEPYIGSSPKSRKS